MPTISGGDWLIVAGDVGERFDEIVDTLSVLRERFEVVIWVSGNHELWTLPGDPATSRCAARYLQFVEALRRVDALTPEDPYPTWESADGPVVVAPLFFLYDYTFRPPGTASKQEALAVAEAAGVLCADEILLHPDPYPSREDWCAARLDYTRARLDQIPADARTVLVNHWPLVREPTSVLAYPEFALCEQTRDWPTRYRAAAVVYGHLHMPRTIEVDGVPHHEVSVGYPHEWGRLGAPARRLVPILGARTERIGS
ncbi:metallophosphoesterase [Brevibacterium sp. Mu109]|uniref:metallophosphoesterase family protein n=1 Tax=Brevibacterium sp. Mu109 TaxID=1255669 RepID=UPI0011AF0157|nr:metallophosphoesterase [Brevibacterium sp. Mu109]